MPSLCSSRSLDFKSWVNQGSIGEYTPPPWKLTAGTFQRLFSRSSRLFWGAVNWKETDVYIYITRHRLRFLNSSVWDVWGNWEPSGFCPNIGKPLKSMEIGRGWPVRKDTPGKNLLPPQCSRLEIPHLVSCLYIIHLVDFPGWFCCLCWRVPSSHATHSIHMWQPVLQTCIMAHIYMYVYIWYIAACHLEIPNRKFLISQHDIYIIYICANNTTTAHLECQKPWVFLWEQTAPFVKLTNFPMQLKVVGVPSLDCSKRPKHSLPVWTTCTNACRIASGRSLPRNDTVSHP